MRMWHPGGAIVALLVPASLLAQHAHLIRGRVTTESGSAIPAADIVVTVAPTAESITAKSDSAGAYHVVIPTPTGEYLLYVGALGRKPFRRRVTIAAPDTLAVVNVTLGPEVTSIAAVRVQAKHPRPKATLGSDGAPGTQAGDATADGVGGRLPPDLQGDLESIASTVPGLSTAGGGISAFGLGSDGNSTLLNGLAFAGTDLPRDARTTTRFRTSVWDPTIGGFSGVQTSVSLAPGGNVTTRTGHVTLDAPALQFSDAAASRLGQRFGSVAADEGGVGAYSLDKVYYNYGIHLARQSAPVSSLVADDPAALLSAGVAPDSAARLLAIAGALGIPLGGRQMSNERTTTTVSAMERVDLAPPPPSRDAPAGPTLALTGYGKYAQSDALTLSPTVTPAFAGRTTSGLAGLQALYARYFGPHGDYLNEATSGLSIATTHGSPYVALPSGNVLAASDDGLATLAFGGNSALASDTRSWTWETIDQTSMLLGGRESLPIKLSLQSRLDGYDQSVATNRLGQYTYTSLADVASNSPATFSRILGSPNRSGGEWIGSGAVGGDWLHDNLTLTGGARVDANAFTAAPAYNPDVERLFGIRTDHAPNGVSVSPRLGFVWRYTPTYGYLSYLGSYSNVYRGTAQIRGGVGKFRGLLTPTLLADASSLTGLPGDTQQLLCVGPAVPAPNWSSFAADLRGIPTTCAGGASSFADTARSVDAFDRAFQPPESWRGNLGWTDSQLLGNYVSVDATYSTTLHQASMVDLNFAGVPQFQLPDEGNRPVFAPAASIVPSTGDVSPAGARRLAGYGTVVDRVSDLRANARQLSATVMPNIPLSAGVIILSYTYVDARVETRGFDASTAGDPRAIEWASSSLTPRHTVIAQWAHSFSALHLSASTLFRVSSGFPFTPLVAGDINGDGSANDRAFVFDPSRTSNTSLASAMQSLLSGAPSDARDCLLRQLGTIAGRNSCTGPWGSTMNAGLVFWPLPHVDDRTRLKVYFTNVTSGLDELLHGADNMRGWGALPLPDATLLEVRGFDPLAKQFIYAVNPRFGSTSPATTIRRAPFRVTLDVELGLGRTAGEQRVEQNMRVRPGLVGTRASADTIKARYLGTAGTDIYALMLHQADALALSRQQVEQFQSRQRVLRERADSIYTPLAMYLATLPPSFDPRDAAKRVDDTRDALWGVIRAERTFVLQVLTPGQIRLMTATSGIGALAAMLTDPNSHTMFFAGGWQLVSHSEANARPH